jgi:HK97 family phage major capsid protein
MPESEFLKRLKAEQLDAVAAQRALLDAVELEGRDLTGEELATIEATNVAYDERAGHIETIINTEKRTAAFEASIADIPTTSKSGVPSDADILRQLARGEIRSHEFSAGSAEERATNSKLSAGAGANLVPTGFHASMFESLIEASSIMSSVSNIMHTTSGENLQLPLSNAFPTAALIAETAAAVASDATFGQTTISAYKYGHSTQVSSELLTDEAINITEFLSRRGGEALGNGIGATFITGTGSAQPTGIMGSAGFTTVASATGSAAAGFVYADVLTLVHSITRPYRTGSSFICNDSVTLTLRKLKDTTGQYLWQPNIVAGLPDMLAGYPIYTDPACPTATTTGGKGLAFGNWSRGLVVRFAGGVRIDSSSDYAFLNDLITFRFLLRADSRIVDTNAARVLTYLT